jgi:AsmA protein
MRALKLSGIVLGCVVSAVILALLAVWLFVNPNDYKERIEQDVKSSTGRDLVLAGPIKLSVFPWIALQLGPVSLGNPPGFGAGPFASVQYASLRVKLVPLLRKRLQIGHIEIDGLDLHLMRNAQGQGNWEIGANENAGGARNAASSPRSATSSSEALRSVAGVAIKDSRVSYQGMLLDVMNVDVGQVRANAPVPVEVKLRLITSRDAKPIDLSGHLVLRFDAARKQYRIQGLNLDGTWTPAKAGAAAVPWGLSAPSLNLDLAAQTVSAPSFAVQLGNARLTGGLQGTRVVDAPSLTGAFRLEPLVLRQWMSQVGLPVPATRDPKALSRFAASGDFAYGGNAARADELDVQLDDSTLRGNAAITNLTTQALTFDLGLDRIDLDRYMTTAPSSAAQPAESKPTQLPASSLQNLDVNGTATIGNATVEHMNVSQVRVTVQSKEGVLRIAPATAQLYGGSYSGSITLDARGSVPVLTLDQSLTGINIAQFLEDFVQLDRLEGRGNITAQLTGRGLASDAVVRSLSGHVAASVANGDVQGIDLGYEINRAIALAERRPMPAGKNTGRTAFSTFTASADVSGGVARTHDLEIASQGLRVTGQGTANLVTDAINYRLTAAILKGPAGAHASGGLLADIPLTVSGTLSSPTVQPDLAELAKAALQQELKGHKQQLQQQLQNKLKSLFR